MQFTVTHIDLYSSPPQIRKTQTEQVCVTAILYIWGSHYQGKKKQNKKTTIYPKSQFNNSRLADNCQQKC